MHDHIERIKERRLFDATTKNYLGSGGKFAVILRAFGSPIVSEDGGYYSSENLADPYELPLDRPSGEVYDPTIIHDAPEESHIFTIGYIFDGLSRGMHIEIKYLSLSSTMTVHFHGNLVFREESGELTAFVPSPEWEGMIERIFKKAQPIAKSMSKQQAEENEARTERKFRQVIKDLKKIWGF